MNRIVTRKLQMVIHDYCCSWNDITQRNRTKKNLESLLSACDTTMFRDSQLFWANKLVIHPHAGWLSLVVSCFIRKMICHWTLIECVPLSRVQFKRNAEQSQWALLGLDFLPSHTLTFKRSLPAYCSFLPLPHIIIECFPVLWFWFVEFLDIFPFLFKVQL